MVAIDSNPSGMFPARIADGVRVAVAQTFAVICGERPVPLALDAKILRGPCIAGIISFIGDVPWSYSLVLTQDSAPRLAKKYFGLDVPFESADMGDVVGELANVLAGDVVAQMEQRRIVARMSLPTVARGSHLEFMPDTGPGIVRLEYMSIQGPIWLRLMTVTSKLTPVRFPGT